MVYGVTVSAGSARRAMNQSGQAEGDHHQSNHVPHPPNIGHVAPSGDEINGTVQVEDVLAQHRQCNRAPCLPSNAHLRTIHNQQVSSHHSSSTPFIAAEEGEVSDLELPPSVPLPVWSAVQSSAPPVAPVASSATENSDPSQPQFYSPSICNIIEHVKQVSHCNLSSIHSFPPRSDFNSKAVEYINEAIAEYHSQGLSVLDGWWPQYTVEITKLLFSFGRILGTGALPSRRKLVPALDSSISGIIQTVVM
ncbi:hypothetical protein BDN67DRAFT_1018166 [Paxillus ammoniavirescens]|nr:hypothetical protein BDN67DRAFT_1018166 [Paxillus ammoniavirescens]